MAAQKHFKSSIDRAKRIRALTELHYEPGNNARCYKSVWRRYIYPVYPMCYRTYLNYLNMEVEPEEERCDVRQLTFLDQLFAM